MNEISKSQKRKNKLVVLSKFMRYLVENAYTFTVAVMGLVHATLAVIFLIIKI